MSPRVALIPGGVRGIGRAVALRALRDGWRVAASARDPGADGDALMDEARALGAGDALLVEAGDATDAGARDALVARCTARFGAVDALVYAVGPFARGPLMAQGADVWRAQWEANVVAYVELARAVVPAMRARRWGRVVAFAIAGVERLAPAPTVAAYVAAKAGALAFTRALARDAAADGVTANAVSPGVIDTGGVARDVIEPMRARIPAGRFGTADEAAAAVMFLLSDDAGYVNGANLDVGGAWGP